MAQQLITEQPTCIGLCEGWCGRVDHHLVDGMCAECRERCATIDAGVSGEVTLNLDAMSQFLTGTEV